MKKLLASLLSVVGLASQSVQAELSVVSAFERVVRSSKASGDFMPAYESFANTDFYVLVHQNDSGAKTKDFRFVITESPQDQKPCVIVSEDASRLKSPRSSHAIRLSGAKLIEMLNPEVAILVGLSDGGFGMPPGLIGWIRESLQQAR